MRLEDVICYTLVKMNEIRCHIICYTLVNLYEIR